MVRHHLLEVIRIRLHAHEVVNVVEADGHDAVVVGHVGELRTDDLGHEGASFGGDVGLCVGVGGLVGLSGTMRGDGCR